MGEVARGIAFCMFPLTLALSRKGRGDFLWYAAISKADDADFSCFFVVLSALLPIIDTWQKISAVLLLEFLHERNQRLDPCLGEGVVDRRPAAADGAMALEAVHPECPRCGERRAVHVWGSWFHCTSCGKMAMLEEPKA